MEKINNNKIKKLLIEKGETQIRFAEAINSKPSLISAVLNGNRDMPMKKILKISKFFNVSPFDLVKK